LLAINRVYHMDCLEGMKHILQVDMIFADPPYNISSTKQIEWKLGNYKTVKEEWDTFSAAEFREFNREWIKLACQVLKPNGNLFICGSIHNIFQIGSILQEELNLRICNLITWFKRNAMPNVSCKTFTHSCEYIIWAVNNRSDKASNWIFNYQLMKKINGGKQMRDMWDIPMTPKSEKWAGKHPTQKPEALLERIILAGSNEGDLILDPFMGSGTTAVVAKRLNRNFIGFETNKSFVDICYRRLERVS